MAWHGAFMPVLLRACCVDGTGCAACCATSWKRGWPLDDAARLWPFGGERRTTEPGRGQPASACFAMLLQVCGHVRNRAHELMTLCWAVVNGKRPDMGLSIHGRVRVKLGPGL